MREREERGWKGKEGKGREGKWEGKEASPPTFITKFTPMNADAIKRLDLNVNRIQECRADNMKTADNKR